MRLPIVLGVYLERPLGVFFVRQFLQPARRDRVIRLPFLFYGSARPISHFHRIPFLRTFCMEITLALLCRFGVGRRRCAVRPPRP